MNLSHDSPELENAFWIIADPNKPFPSSPLGPFQFCQFHFFLFLCLWLRRFAIFPHSWILTMNCETAKVYLFLLQKLSKCIWDFKSLLAQERTKYSWQHWKGRNGLEGKGFFGVNYYSKSILKFGGIIEKVHDPFGFIFNTEKGYFWRYKMTVVILSHQVTEE